MSVVCRGGGPTYPQRPKSSSACSGKLLTSKVCDLRDPDNPMTATATAPPTRPQTSYNMYPFQGMNGPERNARIRHLKKPSSASWSRSSSPRRPIGNNHHHGFDPSKHSNNQHTSQVPTLSSASSSWHAVLPRPTSPLAVTPAAVLDHLAHETHPRVKPSDLRYINTWLRSLDDESKHFTSYFLFCELKFRESSVLATGKAMPNRLRTAVAFHCLQHATSLFGRYQHVLDTICQSLGAAIYADYDVRLADSRRPIVSAVDWYDHGMAYFEQSEQLRGQLVRVQAQLAAAETEAERLKDEVEMLTSQCDALKRLRGRNTRPSLVMQLHDMGAMDKVDMLFKTFQSFDAPNRRNILVGLIQTVEQNLSAEMLFDVVQAMAHDEGERLAEMLVREYGVSAVKKPTANEHMKKLKRFVTGFGSTLKEVNKPAIGTPSDVVDQTNNAAELQAERATFEKMLLLKTEMQSLKENHEVELQFELDKTKLLEEECKELMTKYQDALKRIPKPAQVMDHGVQVDMAAADATKRKKKRGDDLDGLDEDGFRGISDVIADANLPAKKIRKIFSKKHAMALDDVAGTIASLYQAKMTQDIHDDYNGKPRSGFLGLVEDLFILYYGLKELAIGQLICIDTAIHKFCENNARVRLFGILIGSNAAVCATQPMGPSPEAIDFFLFLVGVLFHVGHYTTQYDHALAVAKLLKSRFGDGIPHSPHSTRINVQEAVHVVQIAFAFDSTTDSSEHTECIQLVQALALNDTIDIDQFLEQVMLHWFAMYDSQVAFMQKLFHSMDHDNNGVLEFHEFRGNQKVFFGGLRMIVIRGFL
ncbi:hypothetical protein, variant 1 [Aphanomyces astaci]|uniref:EF-hand domain-containing protein n=1 Tax=Aphanomyces astaci TaxID=112090 RepID=W4GF82_APHAT|nr:hypothetical protein, variant 1 [Aphanomyces astaci]ETV78335.1 hypothetical protein, variant 1 [Aphanomyces astaci]|eukprot:XP_009831916.1 hypothetical protein, variant 1 [Aphanomyces astaci]